MHPILINIVTLKPILQTEMANAYKLKVPLVVDLDIGDNWLEVQ